MPSANVTPVEMPSASAMPSASSEPMSKKPKASSINPYAQIFPKSSSTGRMFPFATPVPNSAPPSNGIGD